MTYTTTANGTYSLELTDLNGCSGADAIVGTRTLDISGFQIYPNPTHDRLTVQGGHPETCVLSLLDVMGRLQYTLTNAWHGEVTNFDVSGLPSGQYWLKIQSATGVGLRRVVKE